MICGIDIGSIDYTTNGGTGDIISEIIDIDGKIIDPETELIAGRYELILSDTVGCEVREFIIIQEEDCTIYIPTIFSPTSQDKNSKFEIGIPEGVDILIQYFTIYDRWGNQVFNYEPADSNDAKWWDGNYNNTPVEQGVYTYIIKLVGSENKIINGSITLVR